MIEISLSFPPILLALFFVAMIGTGAQGAVIAIGLGAAPGFARLAENYATSVGSKEFVASARATGVSRGRLIARYLLPNMAEPLVLAGLAYFAGAIIDISGLDFLGLGVQPPSLRLGHAADDRRAVDLRDAVRGARAGGDDHGDGDVDRLPRRGARTRAEPAAVDASARTGGVRALTLRDARVESLRRRGARPQAAAARRRRTPTRSRRRGRARRGPARAPADGRPASARCPRRVVRARAPARCSAIVGETGSGKTLTALSIAHLLPHPLRLAADAARARRAGARLAAAAPAAARSSARRWR